MSSTEEVWSALESSVHTAIETARGSFGLWWRSTQAFYHAVDWSEPWIQAIVTFHLITFMTIIVTRRWTEVQSVFIFMLCTLGFSLHFLNQLGAEHWESFATQNYFDENGMFIATMIGMPAILNLLLLLILMLKRLVDVMIKVKRMQFRRAQAAKKSSTTEPASAEPTPAK